MRNILLLLTVFILYGWTIQSKDERELISNISAPLQDDDFIYDFVDVMPQFPGGKVGLEKYIDDNLNYPSRLKKEGIAGKVYTECVIEKNGEVTNEKVYMGISRKLEAEALKLIKRMPNWIPGKHKNKNVRVKCTIPIEFKLD